MPNIPEYNATSVVTPDDKGIQAAEVAGRRLGVYGHQEEQVAKEVGAKLDQHQADMELSHGYAASTTMEAGLTEGWNQFVADPAHKPLVAAGTAAQVYMQQVVTPTLQGLGEGFQTQQGKRFVIGETNRIQQNLYTRTTGEQSALTGEIFRQNYTQTQSNMQSSVLQDPSDTNVEQQLALNSNVADALPAGVTGENRVHAMELKTAGDTRIALSAYAGQMEVIKQQYAQNGSSPAEAQMRERIAGQKWFQYLGGHQEELPKMLDEAVEQGQKLYKANQSTQEQAVEDQGRQALVGLNIEIHQQIAAGKSPTPEQAARVYAVAKQYAGTKGLTGDVDNLLSLVDTGIADANTYKYQTTDNSVGEPFNARALLPNTDPHALTQTEVDRAFSIDHKLSVDDHARLSHEIDERNKPDSLYNQSLKSLDQWAGSWMRPTLTHSPANNPDGTPNLMSGGTIDPAGDQVWAEAQRSYRNMFQTRVGHGEDPAAVSADMQNPNSPNFAGRWVDNYNRSRAGQPVIPFGPGAPPGATPANVPTIAAEAGAKIQAAGPIKPGESWTAYKARAGL